MTRMFPPLASLYPEIHDLSDLLGDVFDESNDAFGFRAMIEAEEASVIPSGAVEALDSFGFPALTVPAHLGGRLRNLEQLTGLTRTLAACNPTLAVKFGSSLLGANPVWIWGSDEQRARVAEAMSGGAFSAFAVSEREHGSDLRSSESSVRAGAGELRLSGEKWPIGNATNARFLSTLARTEDGLLDVFLVDKERVPREHYECLPQVPTVGLRGHDLSGIRYENLPLSESDRLGRSGAGLALVLKTLQITKTGIGAISLGVIDASLGLLTRYIRERQLYGAPISQIPAVAQSVAEITLDALMCEAVLRPVVRALTIAPQYLSLWSAAVKALLPSVADECLATAAGVLAARSYIRGEFASGAFQKFQRDHAIAAIFEGTTNVNLHAIASQLPSLSLEQDAAQDAHVLDELFDFGTPAPSWTPSASALRLTNEGQDPLLRSFLLQLGELERLLASSSPGPAALAGFSAHASELRLLHGEMAQMIQEEQWHPSSPAALSAARVYTLLLAASCVVSALLVRLRRGGEAQLIERQASALLGRIVVRINRVRAQARVLHEDFGSPLSWYAGDALAEGE